MKIQKTIKINELFKIYKYKKFHVLQVIKPFLILKHLESKLIVIVEMKIMKVVANEKEIVEIIIITIIIVKTFQV